MQYVQNARILVGLGDGNDPASDENHANQRPAEGQTKNPDFLFSVVDRLMLGVWDFAIIFSLDSDIFCRCF